MRCASADDCDPAFFDSMMMKFLAVADGTAATGLALAMIAAAIAYFSSGRLRRVMNFTLTATALEMTTFSIGVTAGAHSAAVKREAERLAKGVEHAQQVVILHWMRELERGPMDCTTRWQGTA